MAPLKKFLKPLKEIKARIIISWSQSSASICENVYETKQMKQMKQKSS